MLFYDVDATTTGNKFNLNFPTWSTYVAVQIWASLTTGGFTITNGITISTTPTTASATSPATSGNQVYIEGVLFSQSNDFIDFIFSSEVASPAYIKLKSGSFLTYNEVY
jgi:hypothetical protein